MQGVLSMYQLLPTEIRPFVGLSVAIKEDFTWTVNYHDLLVPLEHCIMLHDLPAKLDSGMVHELYYCMSIVCFCFAVEKILMVLATLDSCKVCEGNSDEYFTSLSNIRENVMMDHSSKYTSTTMDLLTYVTTIGTSVVATMDSTRTGITSIYHSKCEIIMKSSVTPARCASCKKHRKSLSAMVSRPQRDERTHPSSHTTYACLTPRKCTKDYTVYMQN